MTGDDSIRSPRVLRGLSTILELVAQGAAVTRAQLSVELELSRSTVAHRVDLLVASGLLRESAADTAGVGRPPVVLSVDDAAGILLTAEIGANHLRVAASGLDGRVRASRQPELGGTRSPGVLEQTLTAADEVLAEIGCSRADVIGFGASVASPVDAVSGDVLRPPYLTAWAPRDLHDFLSEHFPGSIVIENDANAMAVGEAHLRRLTDPSVLFVKLGMGIGTGILIDGRLNRGATWCAGDIGHTRRDAAGDARCRCGGIGCLETRAAGWAICQDLQAQGIDVTTTDGIIRAALGSEPAARSAVSAAGREIGKALASAVSLLNPSHLILGGELAQLEDDLLAEIRGVVYQRSVPLTTRALIIEGSIDSSSVALVGMAVLLRQHILSPAGLGELLNATSVQTTSATALA